MYVGHIIISEFERLFLINVGKNRPKKMKKEYITCETTRLMPQKIEAKLIRLVCQLGNSWDKSA